MSKRSDILNVFAGQNPEYVPWFGDLAYWIDYLMDEKLMPETYLRFDQKTRKNTMNQGLAGLFEEHGQQQLHRDLGVGFYLQGYFPFRTIYDMDVHYEENERFRITKFATPYGELEEIWEYVWSTHSWAPKELLVKSPEDIRKLVYVYEHTRYEADYCLAKQRRETVGDNGVVLVYAPKSPLMELIALKAGVETVVELYMDAEEEFEDLLELMKRKHDEALELVLNCPADCIMVPDNMSSEVVGGAFYDDYIEAVHQEWTKKIKAAGKISYVHLDGKLVPLLTKLSKTGFDVIEAVTPMPVGDVALEEMRAMVDPETIIWGGIPGGFFTDQLNDAAFDEFVIHAIELMKNNNRFVLGVADQVVPTSSFERIKRVSQLIEQYGKYDGGNKK